METLMRSAVPAILTVLGQGDFYGYEIVRKLKRQYIKTPFPEAAIYPLLRKLEKENKVMSYWIYGGLYKKTRKYYHLNGRRFFPDNY